MGRLIQEHLFYSGTNYNRISKSAILHNLEKGKKLLVVCNSFKHVTDCNTLLDYYRKRNNGYILSECLEFYLFEIFEHFKKHKNHYKIKYFIESEEKQWEKP